MSTSGQVPTGTIETLSFARLLAQFWDQGFTGSFRAQAEVRPGFLVTKEILLERGKIAWAASDDEAESIREFLLNKGTLNAEQWRLAEEKAGGAQTRQVLLDLGFLSPRELQTADRERVTGIVLSLFNWRRGDYAVAPANMPPHTPNLKIDPRDLVLEGLMASGDRERVLKEIETLDAVYIVRPDDLVRASLSLPVEMVELMGRADGTRTVSELCALSPLPDFLVSAALAALKVLGLARPVDRDATDAPPPPTVGHESQRRSRTRRSRSGKSRNYPGEPMLPYDEPAERSSANTTPAAAVPTAKREPMPPSDETMAMETPVFDSEHESRHDSEFDQGGTTQSAAKTVKIETPPEGVHTTAHPRGSSETPPAADTMGTAKDEADSNEESNSGKVVWANDLVEHEENPIWSVVTPPKVRVTTAIPAHGADGDSSLDDESQDDLKPGIPVAAIPSPIETPSQDQLDDGEIEDVLGMLSDSDAQEALSQSEEPEESEDPDTTEDFRKDRGREAATEPGLEIDTGDGEQIEEIPGAEEPTGPDPFWQNSDDQLETNSEEKDAALPNWIYEPSGMPPPEQPRTGSWIRWAGLTGMVLLASVSLMLMLSGGAEADAQPPRPGVQKASGPPRVDPPALSPLDERPRRPATAKPPMDTTRNQPPDGLSTASIGGGSPPVASSTVRKALASRGVGDIFHSATYQQAKSLMQQGKLGDAAGKFATLWGGHKGLYTVQLALACESGTVQRAIRSARGSSEFFIMPKEYGGKSCYRLLWGSYPDRNAAFHGRSSVPKVFLKDRSKPFPAPI
jgi:hypothetical protein